MNTPISGRTRLMKMGFLFGEEIADQFKKDGGLQEADLPEYFAWKYGPFSTTFLNDLEFLINQEYVRPQMSSGTPLIAELAEYEYWIDDLEELDDREYVEETFELTDDKGIAKAKELWGLLSTNQQELLSQFKRVLVRAPLDRILEYVYKKYNEKGYIDKSLIRDKYLS